MNESDLTWENLLEAVDLTSIDHKSNISSTQHISYNDFFYRLDIKKIERNQKLCINCQSLLTLKDNYTICSTCGIEKSENVIDGDTVNCADEHSSDTNYYCQSLKIIGKGAHMFQKSVFKTSNADYNRSRHIVNLKELRNLNYQNEDYYIPYNVIKLANDIFTKIREANYVFRKDHKKGVIAACLYYACYMSGIARTPQYISEFVGVEEKFLSQGDRILHDLNEKGVIEIPKKIIPIQQYTYMYFELLDIDKKFIPFVNALIQHAEKSKMHLLHDSKNNTKCIGAIYVLVQRFPKMKEEISIERIEKVCKISKTTVNRYSKMVFKYVNIFKVIFKRYRIPMPNKWRDGVEKKQTRTRKKRLF